MIRQDKFKVGDKVEFLADEFSSWIAKRHRERFGPPPYAIQAIFPVQRSFRSAGHTQLLMVNGEGFSGWWFKPSQTKG